MLKRIVYVSKAKRELSKKNINDLVYNARFANKQNNITGCLIFYDEIFIQLIEGAEHKMNTLFDSILNDDRHYDIKIIDDSVVKTRFFFDWNLLYPKDFPKNFKDLPKKIHSSKTKNLQLKYLKTLIEEYNFN